MLPIRFKKLIPLIAERAGIPEAEAETICSAYWQRVREMVTSQHHLHIELRGLGTLSIREKNLRARLAEVKSKAAMRASRGLASGKVWEQQTAEIERLSALVARCDEQRDERKSVRQRQKALYSNEHTDSSLG